MKKGSIVIVILLFAGAALAAQDDPEAVWKAQILLFKEATDILNTVKDKPALEAAKPKLEQLGQRLEALAPRKGEGPKERREALLGLDKELQRLAPLPGTARVLAGLALVKEVGKELDPAKRKAALIQVKALELATEAFRVAEGKYPANLEVLAKDDPNRRRAALPDTKALIDPWGRPYRYDPAGPKNVGNKTDIWSEGPLSGEGKDLIGNWPSRKNPGNK